MSKAIVNQLPPVVVQSQCVRITDDYKHCTANVTNQTGERNVVFMYAVHSIENDKKNH